MTREIKTRNSASDKNETTNVRDIEMGSGKSLDLKFTYQNM